MGLRGGGKDSVFQINFDKHGEKGLLAAFAKLKPSSEGGTVSSEVSETVREESNQTSTSQTGKEIEFPKLKEKVVREIKKREISFVPADDIEILHDTGKAYRIKKDNKEIWIPRGWVGETDGNKIISLKKQFAGRVESSLHEQKEKRPIITDKFKVNRESDKAYLIGVKTKDPVSGEIKDSEMWFPKSKVKIEGGNFHIDSDFFHTKEDEFNSKNSVLEGATPDLNTDKAIGYKVGVYENLSEQQIGRTMWFPKSQIKETEIGTFIIPQWLMDAKVEDLYSSVRQGGWQHASNSVFELEGMERFKKKYPEIIKSEMLSVFNEDEFIKKSQNNKSMSFFNKIRSLFGISDNVSDAPVDQLDTILLEQVRVQGEIKKAQDEFDDIDQTLSFKIAACNKLIEKGVKEGADNKKFLVDRLDRITNTHLELIKGLIDQSKSLDQQKVEVEGELITKAIEVTAGLSDENQRAIKIILDVWGETGIIEGEEIDSQAKAITLAIEEVVKGGEGSRGGKVIGHTRNGKPIYYKKWDDKQNETHNDFNDEDHYDAMRVHGKNEEESWRKFHNKKVDFNSHNSYIGREQEKAKYHQKRIKNNVLRRDAEEQLDDIEFATYNEEAAKQSLQKSHEPIAIEIAGKGDVEYDSPVEGHYANVIVRRTFKEGEKEVSKILFLKRASTKVVAPNQFCLPGGHIDEGETIEQAGIRELKEEASLDCSYAYVLGKAKCDDGKWAFYLEAPSTQGDPMLLDGESVNAAWMSQEEWIEADLIFDLKDHLVAMETCTRSLDSIPDIMKSESGGGIEKAEGNDTFTFTEHEQEENVNIEKGQFIKTKPGFSGEGSRGGKVIGHTKSGKPVYDRPNNNFHDEFTSEDHRDAAYAQRQRANKTQSDTNRYIFNARAKQHDERATRDNVEKGEQIESEEEYNDLLQKSIDILSNAVSEGFLESEATEEIIKGGVAQIGDRREWGGVKMEKISNAPGWAGWKKVSSGSKSDSKKKVEIKRHPTKNLVAHAENTSSDQLKKISTVHEDQHIRDAAKRELERRKTYSDKNKPKLQPKEKEPVKDIEGLKDYTLSYAPFREGKITDLSESKKAFQEKSFQKWKGMANRFIKALGIKLDQDNNGVGIYGNTSANAEASALPMISGDPEKVELFAALMGTLSPDKQHSVMVLGHNENGATSEHRVTFKDSNGAEDFVKNRGKYGINDITLIPESNTVVVLEFNKGEFNKNKLYEDYGERIGKHEEKNVNARFIGESEYGGIVQKARNSLREHDQKISGNDYADILQMAHERGSGNEVKEKPKENPIKYSPNESISPEHSKIEKRFGKYLNEHFDKAVEKYEKEFGNVLNADNTRELSKDYQGNKSELSAAVHEPSSAFIKKLYADKLADKTPRGKRNLVYFTAGGTGAGKTTNLQGKEKAYYEKAHIVYDTNMDKMGSAVQKIEQALEVNKKVRINYTYRDPIEAFENGAVPRALRIGRTVPIEAHIYTHTGSISVIQGLKDKYRGNKNVSISVIDNSRGKGNAVKASISSLKEKEKKYTATDLREKLHKINDKLYENGSITESHYKGFRGN